MDNVILYDWLSFTSKDLEVEQLKILMGLDTMPWLEGRGSHGYRKAEYFDHIKIHYDGQEGMGIWCEMSGQGCRAFESYSGVGWDDLFFRIMYKGMKVTRLDVAFDDHTGLLDIHQIFDDTRLGHWVGRSNYWECISSSKGTTCQVGSPQSKVLVRIYDKAAERNKLAEHWIRVELQLRDDRAFQFLSLKDFSLGEKFSGVLLNYLKYVTPVDGDSNRSRWPIAVYWANLLDLLSPISVFVAPGVEYNESRLDAAVFNQMGNAIKTSLRINGVEGFLNKLMAVETTPNPKYDLLLSRYPHLYELSNKMSRLF